jgi:hypothetical protein
MIPRMRAFVFWLVVGSLAVLLRKSRRPRSHAAPPVAILFIGNSYSFGLPRELRRLAARRGRTLRVGAAHHGGWSLQQHCGDPDTLAAIRDGAWDFVVIQEQSRIPSLPPAQRDPLMIPAVRHLAAAAREAGAVPVLYQTWGRRDGDGAGDDFHAMQRRLTAGYQAASEAAGGLLIVPAGEAWAAEMSAGRGAELFVSDGSHPSRRGVRLTAETFFGVLLAAPPTSSCSEV